MVNIFLTIDASNAFQSAFTFLKSAFVQIIQLLDHIILFAGVSLLDFNIAILVFGVLFTAVFSIVRNGVNNAMNTKGIKQKQESKNDE